MTPDNLGDLGANRKNRIEAGTGLLKDHADAPPPDLAHARFGKTKQIGALQTNRT